VRWESVEVPGKGSPGEIGVLDAIDFLSVRFYGELVVEELYQTLFREETGVL
jgi:hypothetical protein